jgi:hypothetical protein
MNTVPLSTGWKEFKQENSSNLIDPSKDRLKRITLSEDS